MGFITPGKNVHARSRLQKTKRKRRNESPASSHKHQRSSSHSSRSHSAPVFSPATSRSATPASSASSQTTSFKHRSNTKDKRKRIRSSRSATPLWSTRKPAALETLPTEILHSIFTHCLNPSLASVSVPLSRVISARHLQLLYTHAHRANPAELTSIFRRRFFNASFVSAYDEFYGEPLDASNTFMAQSLCATSRASGDLKLIRLLWDRGSVLDPQDTDAHLWDLHEALAAKQAEFMFFMVEDMRLKPDTECLRLAMKHWRGDEQDTSVCKMLCEKGSNAGDVIVWRNALALGDSNGGKEAVAFLLEKSAPPGEVLGELTF